MDLALSQTSDSYEVFHKFQPVEANGSVRLAVSVEGLQGSKKLTYF